MSLNAVRIPRDAVPVLKRIADLDDHEVDALVEAVSTGQLRDTRSLKAGVRGAVGHRWQDEDDVNSFVRQLMSLTTLGVSHAFAAPKLAETIAQRLSGLDGELIPKLQNRLSRLLAASDLVALGKAIDVATEHDRVLHGSRVLSDIRPVFDSDVSTDPVGAVITHTLRVDYFQDGETKTISFALDDYDLAQLRDVVSRAEEKQKTMSRLLERIALTKYDLTAESDDE